MRACSTTCLMVEVMVSTWGALPCTSMISFPDPTFSCRLTVRVWSASKVTFCLASLKPLAYYGIFGWPNRRHDIVTLSVGCGLAGQPGADLRKSDLRRCDGRAGRIGDRSCDAPQTLCVRQFRRQGRKDN